MNDYKTQVPKSIGFPLPILRVIDELAKKSGLTRSAFVSAVMAKYLKEKNLYEEKEEI